MEAQILPASAPRDGSGGCEVKATVFNAGHRDMALGWHLVSCESSS